MTIPISSVPAAQTAILTAIKAQISAQDDPTTASQVVVCLGEEPTLDEPADVIRTGEVRRPITVDTFIGSGGQDWLNEEYELDVVVSCWTGDGDPTAIVARAWQLVGYVETAVRTDPSLGELVDMAYPSESTGGEPVWTSEPIGRQVDITVVIRISNLN